MTRELSLDTAYALNSLQAVKDLYADWAESYDTGFADGQGYQLPKEVAMAYAQSGGTGPVLDVGAGTGLGAVELKMRGIKVVDGVDVSPHMLAVARKKGLYRNLVEADITKPLRRLSSYAGIVSAGTFTLGHVGPEGLGILLNEVAPDTLFVISVNVHHFESGGFANFLAQASDQITDLQFKDVRIYNYRADEAHRNDLARLLIFRSAA